MALLTMASLTMTLLAMAFTMALSWLLITHYDSTCDGSTYHRYAYHGSTHYTLFTLYHQVLGQLKASVVVLGGWCIFDQVSTASKRYVTKSAPSCIRSAELHS